MIDRIRTAFTLSNLGVEMDLRTESVSGLIPSCGVDEKFQEEERKILKAKQIGKIRGRCIEFIFSWNYFLFGTEFVCGTFIIHFAFCKFIIWRKIE